MSVAMMVTSVDWVRRHLIDPAPAVEQSQAEVWVFSALIALLGQVCLASVMVLIWWAREADRDRRQYGKIQTYLWIPIVAALAAGFSGVLVWQFATQL
jgi:hypothetical protein